MKTLKESILDDIEVNIMKGNDYNNMYKKAEKDYKKLLDKTTGKVFGQYYQVVIKSKELAYIIAGEHPAYKHYYDKNIYNLDSVAFLYNIDDAFDGTRERHVQVNVLGTPFAGRRGVTIVASYLQYTDKDENISNPRNMNNGVSIKEAVKIISDEFSSKYKTIDDVKQAFMNNVKYTAKY